MIKVIPYIIYILYRLYTLFIKYNEPKINLKNYIVAHFHQDELILIARRRNSNFLTMTSTSKDGSIITKFLHLMGYKTVRGSSSKGGSSALLDMIKLVNKENLNPVIAVDGPRGPIYKAKKGVILLAKKTKLPILPTGIKQTPSFFCFNKSWNKALIPKPFSTVNIEFGNIINVLESDDIEAKRQELEYELLKIKGVL